MFPTRLRVLSVSLIAFALAAVSAQAQAPVERGKYLVEGVAMCGDCHTPKVDGKPDASKAMKGGTLDIQPLGEAKGWHKAAPDISSTSALFTRWNDDGFAKFMETGKNPRGGSAGAPMPQYRFNSEDAAAIVQYLKSLK